MTKAHELRIFFDRARKAIAYVRLTTVRLSVCKFVFAVNIYSRGTVSFITLRDHKPNFAHKPTCRLTNPTKSNIGRVRKIILDRINKKITRASKFNQWRNTASVIECLKPLKQKNTTVLFALTSKNSIPPLAKTS